MPHTSWVLLICELKNVMIIFLIPLQMSSENMVEQFHREIVQDQPLHVDKDNSCGLGSISILASYNQAFNKICIEG